MLPVYYVHVDKWYCSIIRKMDQPTTFRHSSGHAKFRTVKGFTKQSIWPYIVLKCLGNICIWARWVFFIAILTYPWMCRYFKGQGHHCISLDFCFGVATNLNRVLSSGMVKQTSHPRCNFSHSITECFANLVYMYLFCCCWY